MKKCVILLFFLFVYNSAYTQTVIDMYDGGNTPVMLEKGINYHFYDHGGKNGKYASNINQRLKFQSPEDTYIFLEFNDFELEDHRYCSYDYLKIDYGNDEGQFCTKPAGRATSSNELAFDFHSDRYQNRRGWDAKINVLYPEMFFSYDVLNLESWVNLGGLNVKLFTNANINFRAINSNGASVDSGWKTNNFTFSNLDAGDYTLVITVNYKGSRFIFNDNFTISSNLSLISVDKKDPERNMSPADLVNNVLVSGCLTAEGIKYGGDERNGIGFFESNGGSFPLESGIVMSTGSVARISQKPNVQASSDIRSANIDDDIRALTNRNKNDVQILEFDFIPAGDKLEFKYIFASEEYPGYACSQYNDVFAFILSGPGITADDNFSGKNIALTPNGDEVSIRNVNDQGCGDANFYVDDRQIGSTVFNGRTDVFYAKANVQSCKKYHIRLILVDVSDSSYDSAVFLEANSFKSNEVIVKNGLQNMPDDNDIMYEGCDGSYIEFSREDNISEEFNFNITLDGTALNGVDYVFSNIDGDNLGKFPENIIIPANKTKVRYYYKALKDKEIEDDEYFKISFLKSCPCSTTPEYYTKEVKIIDVLEIETSLVTNVRCRLGQPVATISIQLKNGLDTGLYTYNFDNNGYQANNVYSIVNPGVGDTHTVKVMDNFACNTPTEITYTIPAVVPIQSDAGNDIAICEKEQLVLNGSGGIVYKWTCNPIIGEQYLSAKNISNPRIKNNATDGTYVYTLTVSEAGAAKCISSDQVEIIIKKRPDFNVSVDKTEICSGETVELKSELKGNILNMSYEWSGDFTDQNDKNKPNVSLQIDANNLIVKNYSLTITDDNNNCSLRKDLDPLSVYPNPVINLNTSNSILCSDGSSGILNINVEGGTKFALPSQPYIYKWFGYESINAPLMENLSDGIYKVEVSDEKKCKNNASFSIFKELKPKGIFSE